MSQITINTINGQPPYTIYICDYSQVSCTFVASGVTSIPYTFTIPEKFIGFTTVGIKTIDTNNCESFTIVSCITQTPTPSITATPTITNSNTPTNTPTPSVTQTTITPTPTPSFTQTPTLTPTPSPTNILILPLYRNLNCAICLIEKSSDSENIGTYMDNLGMSFYGFTNGTVPDSNQSIFQAEMNVYMDYFYSAYTSGLTISLVPTNQNGPISGPVFKTEMVQGEDPNSVSAKTTVDKYDSFGNLYRLNNFETVEITGITEAWYTWVIPTGLTLNKFQKYIDLGIEDPNTFQLYEMNESLYSNYFTYTGTNFVKTVYRVYTTFPSLDFYLDSSISKIYFKGNSLSE